MGIFGALLQQAMAQQGMPGAPNPFGGGASGGLPPNPFGGGGGPAGLPNPAGSPGSWPTGVPNPFGLPSPAQMASTVSDWFTNPYGTHGSVANPSSLNGINPYGSQISGGNTNPWDPKSTGATYRAPDPNALTPGGWSFGGGNMGYQNQGMAPRPADPGATGDLGGAYAQQMQKAKAPGWDQRPQMKQAPTQQVTSDRWGGGIGIGGPFGLRHQQSTGPSGAAPAWHDVPIWQGAGK